MKRARGRNSAKTKTSSKYDSIDVPEIVRRSSQDKQYINATIVTPKSKKGTKTNTKGKKKTTKKSAKKRIRNIILLLILAVIVIFLVAMGMGWGSGDETGALIPVDMEAGKVNVLLLGVDNDGLRTDAMMLVSYNFKENTANVMSIPRDTQMKVTDRNVIRKINEIHAMHDKDNNLIGPMGSVKAVTALTSVPIHYYVEFSFTAIDELADILGPIEFDVPDIEGNGKGMNYDDPAQDLHIHLEPGLQELTGNQVQQFLRYRKSNDGSSDGSDLSRVKRQQEFIKAVIDQKVNITLIAKLPSIFSQLKKNIKTNFSAGDIIKFGKYLNGISGDAITSYSLPGESKRTSAGWYFVCDLEETAKLITESFGYEATGLTTSITIEDVEGTKNVLTSSPKSSSKNNDDDDEEEDEPKKTSDTEKNTATPTPKKSEEPEKTPVTDEEDARESSDYDYDNSDVISDNDTDSEKENTDVIVSTPKPTVNIPDEKEDTEEPENTNNAVTDSEDDEVITLD